MDAAKPLLPPPPDPTFEAPAITRQYVQLVTAPQEAAAPADVAVDSAQVTGQVVAVVTEDAEAIRVNERRDTIEAPPAIRPPIELATIEVPPLDPSPSDSVVPVTINSEPTVPLAVPEAPPLAAVTSSEPRPGTAAQLQLVIAAQQQEHADRIARERGVTPIRVPSVSKRYDVVAPPRTWRPLIVGAIALSVICVAVTAGAIVWARDAVARAEQAIHAEPARPPIAAVTAAAVVEPVAQTPVVEPTAAVASCSISVTSNVRDAKIFINGKRHGTAPAVIPAACNTAAVVEVRHPRYDRFEQQLDVTGEVVVDAQLERGKTALTLWSDPPGAEVTYNGTVLGKTPLVTKVNRYETGTLWFRAPGRTADWRKILPKQKTKTVSITLKPAS